MQKVESYPPVNKMARVTEPSRDLDKKVARAVGWTCMEHLGHDCDHTPPFSSDIAAAFQLRAIMEKLGWQSNDNLTWMGWGADKGQYGYSIWFKRYGPKHTGFQSFCGHAGKRGIENAPAVTVAAVLAALEIWPRDREEEE